MSIASLRSALFEFFADDSASVLTEYAIVLALLSIVCMLGFEQVSEAATSSVTTDTTGFTNTAASPP
ncbi:MAG: hypothetical protein M3R44_05655 [Candidatus Eremiobacteraeota bacterium]|nr:hypothetical protein [Candidatus Eremiobacteraeota bacterium]